MESHATPSQSAIKLCEKFIERLNELSKLAAESKDNQFLDDLYITKLAVLSLHRGIYSEEKTEQPLSSTVKIQTETSLQKEVDCLQAELTFIRETAAIQGSPVVLTTETRALLAQLSSLSNANWVSFFKQSMQGRKTDKDVVMSDLGKTPEHPDASLYLFKDESIDHPLLTSQFTINFASRNKQKIAKDLQRQLNSEISRFKEIREENIYSERERLIEYKTSLPDLLIVTSKPSKNFKFIVMSAVFIVEIMLEKIDIKIAELAPGAPSPL